MQLACFGPELRHDPHKILLGHQMHPHQKHLCIHRHPLLPGYYHFGIFLFGMTTLGMYSATMGTQPPTPFPTSGHHHITTPHHGRFNERLVHQIYFKIFTYSNNTQELSIMEIPSTGYSRTRDPEHFFFTMTGDWEWSRRAADYWRHFFGVPMRHGGNPFADYYPPDMESAVTQTPQPTITVLATEATGPTLSDFGIWGTVGALDLGAANNFLVVITNHASRGHRLTEASLG